MTAEQGALWRESRHHRRGPNTRALGTTLAAMRAAGQLEKVDEAVIVAARTTAGLLDAALTDPDESRFTLARLSAEHRDAVATLRALAPVGGDELAELLRDLSAPVGHPQDPAPPNGG